MPGRVRQPSSKLAFLEASSNEWQEHQDQLDATKADRKRTKKGTCVRPATPRQSSISHRMRPAAAPLFPCSSFPLRADLSGEGPEEVWWR